MAVPEQTPFIEYTANGTTTVFPLPFQCDKAEYLIVNLDGNEAPVGSWSLVNGSVTFNTAPAYGVVVNIERNTPFQRTTDYQSYNNSFRPAPVNKDFDLIWWKLQELGYRDQVIWLALVKEIADRIAGDEDLQNQINTIDEWLGNLQENVDQNTNDIEQLVNDLSKEIADRIKGDQILKDMFLSMIDEAINEGTINALAITHVDSLEGLNAISNVWDGRTIYVKDLGNYRYDALSTSWVKAYQDADNVIDGEQTQKEINLYGGKKYDMPAGGYPVGAVVLLDNGDLVKSVISENTNNPNTDMTGWVKVGEIFVSAIAKLIAIQNPKTGSIANVLSYYEPVLAEATPYKGGGRFVYDAAKSSINDGVLCFNGWVRVKNYTEADPYMAGAIGDGVADESDAFQRLITATSGNFTIGSVGSFKITKALGFPTVSIQGHGDGQAGRNAAYKMKVTGYGATIIVRSAEAIFTSERSLATPDSTSDLYTGKIEFNGLKFRGDNTASVVFNGDRLYNSRAINCEFSQCSKVLYSYRPKIAHPQGYIQSFSFEQNQFMLCAQIVDAKRAYNFRFLQNDCEICIKGVYIDGNGDPALNACRIDDNMFEGGGMFLKLGAVLGGSIRGNYLEANYQGDTVTSKCHIDIRQIATGGLTSGLVIDGNAFYATAEQKTDTGWVDIRYSGPTVAFTADNRARPVLISNYTNSYSLISENLVNFQIGNSAPNIQRSKIPELHVQHRTDFKTAYQTFQSATHLSAGVHTVAQLDVAQIRAMTASQNRPQTADLNVLIQFATAGGVVVGAAAVKFLIVIQGDEGSGSTLNEAYLGASLVSIAQIPSGLALNQSLPDTMKTHFTNPALSVVREGDKYLLKLSGYAAVSNPNFGSASQIRSFCTLTGYGANNGLNILPMLRF
ncbi:hypothetical protein [Acinetobacter baumannii]|uniref:hypothetical protein n=1 Tax=Acinetobacter baumannii TaxID=470 RepID=UPI003891E858